MKLKPGDNCQWSSEHFYLCRSLVFEKMQNCSQLIQRQSGLGQLRMKMTFPIVIWFSVGVAWGIHNIANGDRFWGIALIAVSTSFVLHAFFLIVNRMDNNERREVREILTAFLAGHKAGLFGHSQNPKSAPPTT